MNSSPLPDDAKLALAAFEARAKLKGLRWELRERSNGSYLVVLLGNPTERFFRILDETNQELPPENAFRGCISLRRQAYDKWLSSPETRLLQQVLSESLTVDQHTFEDDFFGRYITSVIGAEDQVVAAGNHVVFGRRGSGKSSLLVYGMRALKAKSRPYVWVSMQTYDRRADLGVIAGVLQEVLDQIEPASDQGLLIDSLRQKLAHLTEEAERVTLAQLRLLVPSFKRLVVPIAKLHDGLSIFLDDLHVVAPSVQPELLSLLYSFSRGNKVFLKISAIENFTHLWDPNLRAGLEVPNDAQVIRLDYNLTNPEKSREHIASILTAHANYCGLPSIAVLCSRDAISRLVWVAAGVPRDAINIFAQALVKALNRNERKVSVTSINLAASEAADDKMRFVEMDSSGTFQSALATLERIKTFCIREQKKNAFLVQIKNDDVFFESIRKLVDLRLLHVLNPGITPDEAGVRWIALLLDYGFYTGVRAARSIDLFQREPRSPEVKELRTLPRLKAAQQAAATDD